MNEILVSALSFSQNGENLLVHCFLLVCGFILCQFTKFSWHCIISTYEGKCM